MPKQNTRRKYGGLMNSTNNNMDGPSQDTDEGSSQMSMQEGSEQSGEMVDTMFGNVTFKNFVILVLLILLILSFLGVNLLLIFGRIMQFFVALIGPFVTRVLSIFGYTTGTIINTTADVVTDTAKVGIDIVDGTAHSVGNLLRSSSNVNGDLPIQMDLNAAIVGEGPIYLPPTMAPTMPIVQTMPPTMPPTMQPTLAAVLNTSPVTTTVPVDDSASNPIQNNISANKSSWCLVGEYQGRRGCVSVNDPAKCTSGKVYEEQSECLNLHPGVKPQMQVQKQKPMVGGSNWGIQPPPLPMYIEECSHYLDMYRHPCKVPKDMHYRVMECHCQ